MYVFASRPRRTRRRISSPIIQKQAATKLACNDKHMLKQFIAPGKYLGFKVSPKCTTVFNHLVATHYTYPSDPAITKRPYYQLWFRTSGRFPYIYNIPSRCRGPKCHFPNPSGTPSSRFKYAIPRNVLSLYLRNPSGTYKLRVAGSLVLWGH